MRKQTRVITGAGLMVSFLAVGAVAFATIPDSGGVVHGCYHNGNGSLRVIDSDAGQTCRSSETALTWNQTGPAGLPGAAGLQGPAGPRGPVGPQGAAGGALAYAHVNADGTVESDSGNVTVVKLHNGIYCVGVTGGTPHVAVANLDARINVGGSVQTGLFWATGCPAGASDIFVVTRPHGQDGGLPGADRAFYILIN